MIIYDLLFKWIIHDNPIINWLSPMGNEWKQRWSSSGRWLSSSRCQETDAIHRNLKHLRHLRQPTHGSPCLPTWKVHSYSFRLPNQWNRWESNLGPSDVPRIPSWSQQVPRWSSLWRGSPLFGGCPATASQSWRSAAPRLAASKVTRGPWAFRTGKIGVWICCMV